MSRQNQNINKPHGTGVRIVVHPVRPGRTAPVDRKPRAPVGRFRVLVTTYNRPDDLTFLLRDIWGASANATVEVTIFDDASTVDMSKPQALASMLGFRWRRNPVNVGKRGFAARLCSFIKEEARQMGRDELLVVLQDDHRLSEQFFKQVASISASSRFDSLMPARDSRMSIPQWTGYEPRQVGTLIQTQWLDGVFVCTKNVAQVIGDSAPHFDSSRWNDPAISSGFGCHISNVLNNLGKRLYVASRSLAVHTGMDSMMHPEQRKLHPLATLGYIEGEKVAVRLVARQKTICGLAAIPGRAGFLSSIVRSLAPQVDELNVYLNGFHRAPEIVAPSTSLSFTLSKDAKGDLGDAGKFYATLGRRDCVVMSCDDDIVYPRGYALAMTRAAMRTSPSVITAHGSTLPPTFSSYFAARTVHSYKYGTNWMKIHVPGTGVMAFCGDALDLDLGRDFSTRFMSDIHMAVAAKRAKVPVYLINQPPQWLQDAKVPQGNTLYSQYATKDQPQTRELLKVGPW